MATINPFKAFKKLFARGSKRAAPAPETNQSPPPPPPPPRQPHGPLMVLPTHVLHRQPAPPKEPYDITKDPAAIHEDRLRRQIGPIDDRLRKLADDADREALERRKLALLGELIQTGRASELDKIIHSEMAAKRRKQTADAAAAVAAVFPASDEDETRGRERTYTNVDERNAEVASWRKRLEELQQEYARQSEEQRRQNEYMQLLVLQQMRDMQRATPAEEKLSVSLAKKIGYAMHQALLKAADIHRAPTRPRERTKERTREQGREHGR